MLECEETGRSRCPSFAVSRVLSSPGDSGTTRRVSLSEGFPSCLLSLIVPLGSGRAREEEAVGCDDGNDLWGCEASSMSTTIFTFFDVPAPPFSEDEGRTSARAMGTPIPIEDAYGEESDAEGGGRGGDGRGGGEDTDFTNPN